MPPFPVISGKLLGRILERLGWVFHHQRGSHAIYYHGEYNIEVSVPMHKELKEGTLRTIIRQARLTRDEFIKLNSET